MQFRFATIFFLMLLVVITISLQSSFASAQLVSFSKSSADHFGPKFKSKTVVIYPIFTQAAYGEEGF
ncbi:MAG: hypothetical protein KGL95_08750, partial [Patescibacteria group bacterium]|nr:hypothetical protein [Patescibacteria group bacterium]